jgi:DNA-binding CsgD family transcriptional regulator
VESERVTLTRRQIQILDGLSRGLRTKEIAAELGISYKTADAHKYNAFRALEAQTSAQAVRRAIETGYLKVAIAPMSAEDFEALVAEAISGALRHALSRLAAG